MTASTDLAKIDLRTAINQALDEAMEADERVFVLGEDVGDAEGGGVVGITRGLSTKYGAERARTTPISEQAIVGAAVGAALAGMRPVAEIMIMNFLTVALDQVLNHAAKLRYMSNGQTTVPLVIRAMAGAGGGFGAQHSEMLEQTLLNVPGLKVVAPSSPSDAKGLMLAAIADPDPVIFIEHAQLYFAGNKEVVPVPGVPIPIGKANIRREGTDVSIIAYSRAAVLAEEAAEQLAAEGISAEVLDLRTISPLDMPGVLASVAKTRRALIAHESVAPFGAGAEIATRINEELFGHLLAPVSRVTSQNCPVPYSRPLEDAYLLATEDIVTAARGVVASKDSVWQQL